MEQQKSIKKNMFMNIILTASNFVFPLITYSYVARILLAEGTGKVAFVQSILAYFSYIAALGIGGYGVRECAKVRDDKEKLSKLVQEILIINFISTLIAYIALFFVLIIVPKFHTYKMLFIIMSTGILFQTMGMEWLYQSLEKYTYITIRSIIFKIISVILTFILIKSPEDYIIYGGLTIFTTSASNILNFIHARKYIILRRFNHYEIKKHLKPIMVFFMSMIIISIYGHFDSIMLGFMKNDSVVGIYGAALKMKSIILSVSTAVTAVMIPRMSIYFNQDNKHKFYELLLKSFRVTCLLLMPLSIFVILNAKDVLLFVCGKNFISAKPTLIILMLCVIVLSFTNLFGNQILIPKGDEKRYSLSVFIGMWINLALNTLLIPKFAASGAAFATLITECFNVFLMGTGCKKEISYLVKNAKFSQYLIPLLLAAISDYILQYVVGNIPLLFRLSVNTICLFGIYYMLLLLRKEPLTQSVITLIKNKIKKEMKK